MREVGIDLSGYQPRKVTTELVEWAAVVVTMGCGDACPSIAGRRYLEWQLLDPEHEPLERVRQLRDEIERRVEDLVSELA